MNIQLSRKEVLEAIDIYLAIRGMKSYGSVYIKAGKHNEIEGIKLEDVRPSELNIEELIKEIQSK